MMKKLLLGSTALVVGGAIAAPAMAADPIKLGVGGYYTFYALAGNIDSTYALNGNGFTTYKGLAEDLQPGNRVLVDDGLLELAAVASEGERAILVVVRGGTLRSRKGINLPGVAVRATAMTPKDERDLEFRADASQIACACGTAEAAAHDDDLAPRRGRSSLWHQGGNGCGGTGPKQGPARRHQRRPPARYCTNAAISGSV